MLSNKDTAIKENIQKEHTCKTFFKNISIDNNDCHIWQGQIDHKGYGDFGVNSISLGKKVSVKAHRFAYALHHGFDKLPQGVTSKPEYVINHLCYNRACVNPAHLEVITHQENLNLDKRKPRNG